MAILNFVILVFGNALYAFAVAAFVMPSGIVVGGVTGISIFLEKFIPAFELTFDELGTLAE